MNKTDEGFKILLEEYGKGKLKIVNGKIFRKNPVRRNIFIEQKTKNHYGYLIIKVSGVFGDPHNFINILQHRLLYAIYHGLEKLDPDMTINHIDYNKENNKMENLELVSRAYNTHHKHLKENHLIKTKLDLVIRNKSIIKTQLAKKIGVSKQTLSNWTVGHTKPNLEIILKIANELKCDPNELIGEIN